MEKYLIQRDMYENKKASSAEAEKAFNPPEADGSYRILSRCKRDSRHDPNTRLKQIGMEKYLIQRNMYENKKASSAEAEKAFNKYGSYLLSQHDASTIGHGGLNFSVRNGKR
jgi:hypothetical protein